MEQNLKKTKVEEEKNQGKFTFSIDRGGTFTDVFAQQPDGTSTTLKLLSEDPQNYPDAPREGIRRVLHNYYSKIDSSSGFLQQNVGSKTQVSGKNVRWIRMGTTVATNALLERKGAKMALITTKGFGDTLEIGNQSRPKIFDLTIRKPSLLYAKVIEIDERVHVLTEENRGLTIFGDQRLTSFASSVTEEKVRILERPDRVRVRQQLQALLDEGIRCIAVCLLHAYTFPAHEQLVGEIAAELGFDHISLSHVLSPMVKYVPRGQTTCVDAYLTPLIKAYIAGFMSGFDTNSTKEMAVSFMMSDGGLCSVDQFSGYRAILSGPAGGVVGYAQTTWDQEQRQPVIGFDMGGTSTDVSRYAGAYDHVFDSEINGVTIQAPQLDITTVAAGGGSRLFFESGMFRVGPESAGAHPGPVCYRKNGHLAVTDANVFLGRVLPDFFPKIFGPNENESLDVDATRKAFEALAEQVNKYYSSNTNNNNTNNNASLQPKSTDEIAAGFLRVANEAMCRPIRNITEAKGFDCGSHILACFGGAGGQHACAVARALGMKTVFVHKHAGILSAYGLGLADVVAEAQEPCSRHYSPETLSAVREAQGRLKITARERLSSQFSEAQISFQAFLNLRFEGTDTAIMTPDLGASSGVDPLQTFKEQYQREFGFLIEGKGVVIDDVRVRAVGHSGQDEKGNAAQGRKEAVPAEPEAKPQPVAHSQTYFDGAGRVATPVFPLAGLLPGARIAGPAIIIDVSSTILVEPDCVAAVTSLGNIRIAVGDPNRKSIGPELDPILLSVFSHRFMSIAEQMGKALQRTSISTNIKERLDFSCALFGPTGDLVANAPHLPVHLGAMQEAVRFQIRHRRGNWKEGETIISNHPDAGGSHLPDITVITPVFHQGEPIFYVASRGHHADIGGSTPGSMPPFSRSLAEEGACFTSFTLVENGVFREKELTEALMAPNKTSVQIGNQLVQMSGTRNLRENISDLKAQLAANQKGITLIDELIKQYGLQVVHAYMRHIQEAAEQAVRDMLVQLSFNFNLQPIDTVRAKDYMDDGSEIHLALTINRNNGTAQFDFEGTSNQVLANTNTPKAVTASAVIYCLRCLVQREIPLNQGCLNPIEIKIPKGSLLDPSNGAAVVGGNVLTSQRVTDVVLTAFQASACSQGCMNNFTFGDDKIGYYETIAGGAGAGPTWHGASATQVHMTNTRITDAEILERRYPVMLKQFSIRKNSGGKGQFCGGDGVIREIEFLQDKFSFGILSERRVFSPWGIHGGENGAKGKNTLIKASGTIFNLGSKNTAIVDRGDILLIETPGGGGYGKSEQKPKE